MRTTCYLPETLAPEVAVAVFEIGTRLAVTASELTVVGAEVTDPVGRSEVRIRLVSED